MTKLGADGIYWEVCREGNLVQEGKGGRPETHSYCGISKSSNQGQMSMHVFPTSLLWGCSRGPQSFTPRSNPSSFPPACNLMPVHPSSRLFWEMAQASRQRGPFIPFDGHGHLFSAIGHRLHNTGGAPRHNQRLRCPP
jgi:hypothetical protein